MSDTLEFSYFEMLFRPQIRVAVNWRALREVSNKLDMRHIDDRETLGKLVLPWYEEGDVHAPDRISVSVAEAALLQRSNLRHRKQILDLASSFCAQPPAAMIMPAVSNSNYTLLDGVHRAIALYLSGVDFTIALYVLRTTVAGRAAIFDA